jgi:membrane fusion protein (multidrug efflux system)
MSVREIETPRNQRFEQAPSRKRPSGDGEPREAAVADAPTEDAAISRPQPPEASKPKSPWKKRALIFIGGIVLIVGGYFGVKMAIHARHYESTDDAFIEAPVVQIGTKLAGYAQTVAVDDNQHVKAGDLLVQLDSRDQQAKLEQARASQAAAESRLAEAKTQLEALKANVAQAQAEVAAAQANADYAHTELSRYQSMGQGAASAQERSNALSAAQAADANVAAAKSKVASAQASVANGASRVDTAAAEVAMSHTQVEQAALDLSYTRITAPVNGHVTRKSVEPGAYLQQGQAVMALVPDDVWVIANFKETQLTDMRPGQPVDVKVDAYPSRTFKAHVDSIQSGTGSRFSLLPPENATGNYVKVVQRVPVKIVFDERLPDELVVAPGMSVEPDVKVK